MAHQILRVAGEHIKGFNRSLMYVQPIGNFLLALISLVPDWELKEAREKYEPSDGDAWYFRVIKFVLIRRYVYLTISHAFYAYTIYGWMRIKRVQVQLKSQFTKTE